MSIKDIIHKAAVKSGLAAFMGNQKAEAGKMIGAAIMVMVALVVISILGAALLPSAITTILAVNTTTWGAGAISMWSTITIFIVLVFMMIFVALVMYGVKAVTD
jgi:hypothetical protein